MDSSRFKTVLVLVLAGFAALYLGVSAATAQFETVAWILGTLVLAICLLLGQKIWLLIPFLGAINLTVMIPGRPTTMQAAQLLVIGFCLLMFLVRRLKYKFQLTELELWMIILLTAVVQVYMRNPTGVSLLGGDSIGGRPYIIFAMTWVAAMLLAGLRVDPSQLRTAMKLSILGGFVNFGATLWGYFFPRFGFWVGLVSAQAPSQNSPSDPGAAGRLPFFQFFPITLATWLSSRKNPLLACFSVRWLPVLLISVAFAAGSGYRNVIASVGLTYLVGILYWGGLRALLGSCLVGAMGVAGLAAANMVFPFPPNMQRALSFLPGTWESRYVQDAEASSEWRFEIWREVLLTERWIENKVLGDGLGFSSRELEMQKNLMETQLGRGSMSGFDFHRDTILANGDYHSGPISAVRTIGYVGLGIMALAQLRLVVHAHRQIQRARGTEWFNVTLFFCIPIVWTPVFFWLVFGGFAKDAPLILMQAAMLRMLQNNLPLPAWVPARLRAPAPLAMRGRVPDGQAPGYHPPQPSRG